MIKLILFSEYLKCDCAIVADIFELKKQDVILKYQYYTH